jgi:hypothetical protein
VASSCRVPVLRHPCRMPTSRFASRLRSSLCSILRSRRFVVVGAGPRRGVERAGQPFVVDEPGRDDFFLARRAGERAGRGVVPPCFPVAVAAGVRRRTRRGPGRRDLAHPGLGQAGFSVRVTAKMLANLPLQDFDLLVQDGDHGDQRPKGGRAGCGQRLGLAELLAAQRRQDRGRLVRGAPAPGALERRADPGARWCGWAATVRW